MTPTELTSTTLSASTSASSMPTSDIIAAAKVDWSFLLGTPLRVTVIIVVAVLINILVRIAIRRFADSVAKGTIDSSKGTRGLFSASAIAAKQTGLELEVVRERRAQRAKTVGRLLSSVASIIIAVLAGLMVLDALGFNIGPILASAGIAGVALAFGAQALVKDYLSGFFMVIEDQYGIGDIVDLGEAIGTVEDVGLRTTQVRGLDGTLWHVRNGEILRVGNSSQGWARAVLDVPLPYAISVDTYSQVISDTAQAITGDPSIADAILDDPDILGVESLSAQSQVVRTVLKTKPGLQWKVARAFRAELRHQLDRRGFGIPITTETVFRTLPDPSEAMRIADTTVAESADDDTGHSDSSSGSTHTTRGDTHS